MNDVLCNANAAAQKIFVRFRLSVLQLLVQSIAMRRKVYASQNVGLVPV